MKRNINSNRSSRSISTKSLKKLSSMLQRNNSFPNNNSIEFNNNRYSKNKKRSLN